MAVIVMAEIMKNSIIFTLDDDSVIEYKTTKAHTPDEFIGLTPGQALEELEEETKDE